MTSFFSGNAVSSAYASCRPVYPSSLFETVASLVPTKGLAWDVACGTGQAASALANYFDQVIGTDISQTQLDHAIKKENTFYIQCSADDEPIILSEKLSIQPQSVDLITVAQALHFFDLDKFYSIVRYFLKSDGVIAVWTYMQAEFPACEELTELLRKFTKETLGPYWVAGSKLFDNHYMSLDFPFRKLVDATAEPFTMMESQWTLETLYGYIRSWSGFQSALRQTGVDPLDLVQADLAQAWGPATTRRVHFPVYLLAGNP